MFNHICRKVGITLANLKDDARGVSAIEYAILLAVIVLVIVAVGTDLGEAVKSVFTSTSDTLNAAATQTPTTP